VLHVSKNLPLTLQKLSESMGVSSCGRYTHHVPDAIRVPVGDPICQSNS